MLKGRLKQSIVFWCFNARGEKWDAEKTCTVAKQLGVPALEIIGPEHWGTLKKHGLVYDILIFEKHLMQTLKFVDMHPNQVFVVDHAAKPRIKDHVVTPWKEHMAQLAKRPNVYCKISGMVTEADWKNWKVADLRPYIDGVLESFGPRRCMFGSDWPVMLVASNYKGWVDAVQQAISGLSNAERERIMGGTAVEAYKL